MHRAANKLQHSVSGYRKTSERSLFLLGVYQIATLIIQPNTNRIPVQIVQTMLFCLIIQLKKQQQISFSSYRCVLCILLSNTYYSSYTHCNSNPCDWYGHSRPKSVDKYSYSVGRHYLAEYEYTVQSTICTEYNMHRTFSTALIFTVTVVEMTFAGHICINHIPFPNTVAIIHDCQQAPSHQQSLKMVR